MRTAYFNIACTAMYPSSLSIPDTVPEGEELAYIRQNLAKCRHEGQLTWIDDLPPKTAVEQEDITCVEQA